MQLKPLPVASTNMVHSFKSSKLDILEMAFNKTGQNYFTEQKNAE